MIYRWLLSTSLPKKITEVDTRHEIGKYNNLYDSLNSFAVHIIHYFDTNWNKSVIFKKSVSQNFKVVRTFDKQPQLMEYYL